MNEKITVSKVFDFQLFIFKISLLSVQIKAFGLFFYRLYYISYMYCRSQKNIHFEIFSVGN